jgi:hypothetical protein
MSDKLDLDIRNYSIRDIESFFRFSSKAKYTSSEVELRECEIRETLLKSGQVDKYLKADLISFLTSAKTWLIAARCEPPAVATTLPKITRLDPTNRPMDTSKSSGETLSFSTPAMPMDPHLQREKDLVQRPTTQYIHTMNSEYYAGTLNPLATRTITKCLTIDTRFRDHLSATTSSDITIQLPMKLAKVVSMQLASIELPYSFYGISKAYGNTYVNLSIEYDTSGGNHRVDTQTVSIQEGNYTASDLVDAVNTAVHALGGIWPYLRFWLNINGNGSGNGRVGVAMDGNEVAAGYTVSQIRMNNNTNAQGDTDNGDLSNRLAWNLGFTQRHYAGSTTYTSDTLINPFTMRYLYLAVDDFNNSVNNHFMTAFDKSVLSPNILARISVKGNYFNWITEKDHVIVTEPRKYFGPVDIQRLRVQLYDDRGKLLDMNHTNYSFCLNFKMLYDI